MSDLTVRSPFADVRRMLDEWRDDEWRLPSLFTTTRLLPEDALALDVKRSDDGYVVTASVPGFKREDIKVELLGDVLSMSASRSAQSEEKDDNYVRRERYAGSMMRRVTLPGATRESSVEASVKDGELTVTVSVPPDSQAKQIEVHEG